MTDPEKNEPNAESGRKEVFLSELDRLELYAFLEGRAKDAYRIFGARRLQSGEWRFLVYAPRAQAVYLTGDFNDWQGEEMTFLPEFGVWGTVRGTMQGQRYKYAVRGADGRMTLKSDPFAVRNEMRPANASVVWDLSLEKIENTERRLAHDKPVSVYEVHLGSWEKGLSFVGASTRLVDYCRDMGYNAIELMPVYEHLIDESWGYQTSGMYAITARYGTPDEMRLFVRRAHEAGLGVILDWVPAHFVKDDCGLRLFDGTPLYESSDPLRAEMPLWGTLLYDFEKPHVRSYLISNALYLIEQYGIDGLRVDAVSAMLYLDFCKSEWRPNEDGSNLNRAAEYFIKELNRAVHERTGAYMIAEESSAFPHVTGGEGLGFDYKWNMGFMNDTLSYFEQDSVYRKYHQDKLTFPMTYAFSEDYILPFSHDEVVYGKRSLIGRMCGNYEAQFAQLRLLLAYRMAFPGKKLEFMGSEFGQFIEWDFRKSLDWFLLDYKNHRAMQSFARAVNRFYTSHSALWNDSIAWEGYRWLALDDSEHSIIAFRRRDPETGKGLICIFNFTPGEHGDYRIDLSPIKDEIGRRRVLHCVFSSQDRADGRAHIKKGELSVPIWGYEAAFYEI
ncbi:MAG: 1,4-alpha-glucan branching protein GlgB [Clostridiales bacterium]|nr:1,4-alpha-glucan branching protein GlgB [Clostridiales bacterium]